MNRITTQTRDCERSEEMLAYLYDEADANERKSFELHMSGCAACRDEYASFGGVREAFAGWREESFAEAASLFPFAPWRRVEKRSALEAARAFFRLAPVWLQAGVATAALVVTALVAFALVNMDARRGQNETASGANSHQQQHIAAPTTNAPPQKRYSQQEVDGMIAEGVRRGIENYQQENVAARDLTTTTVAGGAGRISSPRSAQSSLITTNRVGNNARRGSNSRSSATQTISSERQTAVARRNADGGVPRLSDLLDVVN